jgi:RNA polymerase sigma factor (sigma-70 family)
VKDPSPDLVARLVAGSEEAFDELYVLFVRRLRRYIKLKFDEFYISYEDAEEIANDVLIYAHGRITGFDPAKGQKLTTWIFDLGDKRAVDFLRKRARKNKDVLSDPDPRIVLPLEALAFNDYPSELKRDDPGEFQSSTSDKGIQEALNSLTEQERNVLLCAQTMKNKEIAEAFNISVGNVRTIRHRAAKKIRLALEKQNNL